MSVEAARIRTWARGERLPVAQRLAPAALFVALRTVLGAFSVPVGPARVAPFST
jgi:predicted membrane protein